MAELSVVGKNIPRIDALDKVTGKTKYTADFKESMLHAKVVRSPHAHAKIISIDTSRAEKLPGVRGVVTPKDAPSVRVGYVVCADRQMLPVEGRVRYVGEPVAVVVADSPEIAEEAVELVEVNYEVLPAVFDPEEAMERTCPVVPHPDKNTYGKAESSLIGCTLETEIPNVVTRFMINKGDIEKGFQEADVIVENRYTFDGGSHARPELYVVDAWVDGDVLTVRTARPRMWGCHGWLCKVFSMPPSKVRVITPYTGGMFGGKGTPLTEALALMAAMKTGKRVRLQYTREEEFIDTNPRAHKVITYIKDGAKKDGTIVARQTRVISDIGAYGAGGGTLSASNSHLGNMSCYKVPNRFSDSITVYTNKPPTGTLRGVESPQLNWAMESNLDCLAHELGMDPVELRRKNLVRDGDTNDVCQVLHDIYPRETLDKTAELMNEWDKKPEPEGKWKYGRGLAFNNWMAGPWWPSAASVKIYRDGTIEARIGTDATGQGLINTISQIVAEEFGTSVDKVKIVRGDTLYTPWDWGSIASRATWNTGNAVVRACQNAKQQLFKLVAQRLEAAPEDLETSDGKVYPRGAPEKAVSFGDLFIWDYAHEVGEIIGEGTYEFKYTDFDPKTGYSPQALPEYGYLSYGVEVAVNTETGEIKVLRVANAVDIGQPINWKMCEGQIEGGIGMGIGFTLTERFEFSNGVMLNPNLMSYKVPTAMEVPSGERVKSASVGKPHPDGPYGAKSIGEATLVAFPAALGNAVYDAIGVRLTEAPMTRERVFKALQAAKQT